MSAQQPTFKDRLERYCYVHNPKNVPKIAALLKSFQGKEDQMFKTLSDKYGPLPSEDEAARARLQLFFRRYNPEKLSTVDDILAAYSGHKRAELFPALVAKYGPEVFDDGNGEGSASPSTPPRQNPEHRSRLLRFLEAYAPDKVGNVDRILAGYAGNEAKMFEGLVAKYGPEPSVAGASPTPQPSPSRQSALASPPTSPAASPGADTTDIRRRIEAMYDQYAPDKKHTIDANMERYKGQEAALMEALVKKYGPEPSSSSGAGGAAAAAGSSSNPYRSRLERFMQQYNPEKLSTIDKILDAYKGREQEMFEALVKKYGPEPSESSVTAPPPRPQPQSTPSSSSSSNIHRGRLLRFMQRYNPEKIETIDKILDAYKGREVEMFEALVKKYGPEPADNNAADGNSVSNAGASGSDHRARLIRFMEVYNPERLSTIDKILEAYQGREQEMFEALVKKYGPEPEEQGAAPPAPSAATATATPQPPVQNDNRSRLIRFMQTYNPEKLDSIDKILNAYQGRESEMFEALVKKYGPEPSSNDLEVSEDQRSRLARFMQQYNPEKLSTIDKILDAYKGREQEMFEALVKKYGPEPPRPAQAGAGGGGAGRPPPQSDDAAIASFMGSRGITADDVLFAFKESDLLLSLSRVFGPLPDTRDIRTRVTAFMQRYNPEKLASVDMILKAYSGRDDEMMTALINKYGPEPMDGVDDAGSPGARVKVFLERKKLTSQVALFSVFPSKRNLLEYLQSAYGDFEGRLRRLFVRHCPEDLEHVEDLLENHRGDEEALLADLVQRLGPEPPNDAPSRIVNLLTNGSPSSRLARIEEENAISDTDEDAGDSAATSARALQGEPPAIVKEGHLLIRDSERAPPGDYSGDEGKAFPGEEEYWLQLRIGGNRDALEASPSEMRRRTYSEYNPEMSDGDAPGSPGSPQSVSRFRAESSFTPRSPRPTDPASSAVAAASVEVCSKLGKSIAALCLPCSKKVVGAFDALWQPVGPGHKKVLSSSTTKEGFLEKLSTSRLGTKWQRRYFRVNDKGILYYETNQPNEKPKGYKVLTRRSTMRDAIDGATNSKCSDTNFYYFSVSCNETNEEFLLRTPSKDEREAWVTFLSGALERVRLTNTGQDPVPARWRARVGGAKLSTSELVVQTEESNTKARALQLKRDSLIKELQEESQQLDITKTRSADLVEQEKQLRSSLNELVEQVGAAEEEAELKCLSAAEAASQVVLQRESLDKELVKARQNVEKMTEAIVALEKQVVELEHVKHHENLKLEQVFQKWRNVEQRPKSPNGSRSSSTVVAVGRM
ncbi:Hypothetical protein, putative [Bodo saltans]|uniref:PH domain-containing protein n=1 Tax=Bodo saltans TaxID=75058 RepID=A0A0S4JSF5_BODSA|nr:Hypothetical protein, putative [Bodo saltans]|eukprot:CUG93171.1 Hypothetical protein, putative [Bodo saltans]